MSDKRERRFKYNQCTRKVRYSEEMARFKARTGQVSAYKCMFCPDWHVASTESGRTAMAMREESLKSSAAARRRRRMGR